MDVTIYEVSNPITGAVYAFDEPARGDVTPPDGKERHDIVRLWRVAVPEGGTGELTADEVMHKAEGEANGFRIVEEVTNDPE